MTMDDTPAGGTRVKHRHRGFTFGTVVAEAAVPAWGPNGLDSAPPAGDMVKVLWDPSPNDRFADEEPDWVDVSELIILTTLADSCNDHCYRCYQYLADGDLVQDRGDHLMCQNCAR